jgi:hypothetical protein
VTVFAQETTPAEPKLLADGAGAKYKRFDNMHQVRYIELFLAGREAKTGNIVAACYNTMLTDKGVPTSRDTSPQALVENLDLAQIKQEHGLLGANLNGPKLWQPDWLEVDQGAERTFGGMPMAWVAQLNVPAKGGIGMDEPYKPMTIARKSGLGWNKGTTVFLLDDARRQYLGHEGLPGGAQAPTYTYDEFKCRRAKHVQAASRRVEIPRSRRWTRI